MKHWKEITIALGCFIYVVSVGLAYLAGRMHELKYWEKQSRINKRN